eukprot:TRINITY_DN10284_c0_g2_i3.p2 TRINITY_DN10284_c0_g2~~TRINITY_DN10284_c0_g2_i3.p2  ORF type:complete len:109 (+),score=25.31 TRINITY_DN10284_c0_g2_i3:45-371(+)
MSEDKSSTFSSIAIEKAKTRKRKGEDSPKNGDGDSNKKRESGRHLAQMLKGGVIMDVATAAQARIAEEAGATAVMALERIPSDIRKMGEIGRAVQQECRDRSRMPSSA